MSKNIKLSRKLFFPASIFVATIVLFGAAVVAKSHPARQLTAPPAGLVDSCAQKNTITYTCYKNELTNLTMAHGPEKAFALVKQNYAKNSYVKSQCHQLAHVIGRAAYAKYGNLADTFAHGDQYCWAGYYHGVMEKLAAEQGTEKFLASLPNMCSQIKVKKYSFNYFNCVHGLGHGVMEALSGDLFAALSACDKLNDNFDQTSCYGGVFMQNIMTVQSPDETISHQSAYLKPGEPMYPCTAVDERYKDSCYLTQTSYALQTQNYDFKKVFALCSQVESTYRGTCYNSLGRDASGQSVSDVEKTKATCLLGTGFEAQNDCIIGAAKDFTAYFHSSVQANKLCASLPEDLGPNCYSTVRDFVSHF